MTHNITFTPGSELLRVLYSYSTSVAVGILGIILCTAATTWRKCVRYLHAIMSEVLPHLCFMSCVFVQNLKFEIWA